MRFSQNEHCIDRSIRILLGEVALLAAFFWLSGGWQIAAYVLSAAMIVTGLLGYCGFYQLAGINTKTSFRDISKALKYGIVFFLIVLFGAGIYASVFFTKKMFVEDFNRMNAVYKQTLYNSGQDKRQETIAGYESFVVALSEFKDMYSSYKPYAVKSDEHFDADISKVLEDVKGFKTEVYEGDLRALHVKMEGIKNVFQDILKRNNFSLIGMALLDFHDAMEVAVEAGAAKDPSAVLAAYQNANEKLQAVEAMAADEEIRTIRTNLEALRQAAEKGEVNQLPALGASLKSSFVKTYLVRN